MSKMARALLDAQVDPALAEGDGDETEPVPGDGAASKVPDAEEKGTEEDEPEPDVLSLGQASESDAEAESCREHGDDADGGDGSCGNGDDNERPPVEAASATCPSTAAESNADDQNRASQVTQGGGNLAAAPPEEAASAGAGNGDELAHELGKLMDMAVAAVATDVVEGEGQSSHEAAALSAASETQAAQAGPAMGNNSESNSEQLDAAATKQVEQDEAPGCGKA